MHASQSEDAPDKEFSEDVENADEEPQDSYIYAEEEKIDV